MIIYVAFYIILLYHMTSMNSDVLSYYKLQEWLCCFPKVCGACGVCMPFAHWGLLVLFLKKQYVLQTYLIDGF